MLSGRLVPASAPRREQVAQELRVAARALRGERLDVRGSGAASVAASASASDSARRRAARLASQGARLVGGARSPCPSSRRETATSHGSAPARARAPRAARPRPRRCGGRPRCSISVRRGQQRAQEREHDLVQPRGAELRRERVDLGRRRRVDVERRSRAAAATACSGGATRGRCARQPREHDVVGRRPSRRRALAQQLAPDAYGVVAVYASHVAVQHALIAASARAASSQQPRLADAGLADDLDQAPAPARAASTRRVERGQLGLAADEREAPRSGSAARPSPDAARPTRPARAAPCP